MQSPFVNIMQCPRNTVAGSKARVDEGVIASPYHALIIMQLVAEVHCLLTTSLVVVMLRDSLCIYNYK